MKIILLSIREHLFDFSSSNHGYIIDYLKKMDFFVSFLITTCTIFFTKYRKLSPVEQDQIQFFTKRIKILKMSMAVHPPPS